jgi:hypothetical protein
MALKYYNCFIWGFVFILLLFNLSGVLSDPSSPVAIHGKVLYDSGDPVEGIKVTATWNTFEGEKSAQTKTLDLKEAWALGNPELTGIYIFLSGQIPSEPGLGIAIKASDKTLYVNRTNDPLIISPDIILGRGYITNEKKSISAKIKGFIYHTLKLSQPFLENEEDEAYTQDNSGLNNPPSIIGLPQTVYLCGGENLNLIFNVADKEKDNLTLEINPSYPFKIYPKNVSNSSVVRVRMYSEFLGKQSVGLNELTVIASDAESMDYKKINITVFDRNYPPKVEDILPITLETGNDNKVFYMQVKAYDEEDGNQDMRNLNFNMTFLEGRPIFEISKRGTINANLNKSYAGFYKIQVCVTDNGVKNLKDTLNLCDPDMRPATTCKDFTLTVIEKNHEPEFASFYPGKNEGALEYSGNDYVVFNVTKEDADGNIPSLKWYLDGELKKIDFGNRTASLNYQFGCSSVGNHTLKAEITDGLIIKYMSWNINITNCSYAYSLGIASDFFRKDIEEYKGKVRESRHSWKYWGVVVIIIFICMSIMMIMRLFLLKKKLEKINAIRENKPIVSV